MVGGALFAELPLDAITPNPRQPRPVFDEEALAELVRSLREVGLLQPVVVRPLGEDRYELIMGERRWRAAQEAGLHDDPGDRPRDRRRRRCCATRCWRTCTAPAEPAGGGRRLRPAPAGLRVHPRRAGQPDRPVPAADLEHPAAAQAAAAVQRRVAAGVLSAGHARALLGLDDAAAQERLAQRIVAEGLSVRTVEEIVAFGGDRRAEPGAARPQAGGAEARRPGRPALRPVRDPGQGRPGRSKGRIVVEFGSIDDLERIVALMAPDTELPPDLTAS